MGFFSPVARRSSAEGRSILMILLILSNYFLKIRIHSSFLPSVVIRFYFLNPEPLNPEPATRTP